MVIQRLFIFTTTWGDDPVLRAYFFQIGWLKPPNIYLYSCIITFFVDLYDFMTLLWHIQPQLTLMFIKCIIQHPYDMTISNPRSLLNIRPTPPRPGAAGLDHQRWGGHSKGTAETCTQRFEAAGGRRGSVGSWSGNPLPQTNIRVFPKIGVFPPGKPYEQMDDLGGKHTIFGNTHINLTSNRHNETLQFKEWEVVLDWKIWILVMRN